MHKMEKPSFKATQNVHIDTQLAHCGLNPRANFGFVNPPVVHASTVVFDSVETMQNRSAPYSYGRRGTPTTDALTQALCTLENAAGVALAPSGLAAISLALLSVTKAGAHILVADSVYDPTRYVCDHFLKRFDVAVTYYDPLIGDNIVGLCRDNTVAIFTESPGSRTFEVQDIPAICAVARPRDIAVIMDNTWATPLHCKPLALGVDLSIQAGTKYIGGHSDIMLGTIAANEIYWPALSDLCGNTGMTAGPDDVYLALRGLRTMGVRLERHHKNTMAVINWLRTHDKVHRILYPALAEDPGHTIWRRDFTGATGLFGVELVPARQSSVHAFLDSLRYFGLGFSWGGFESLIMPCDKTPRTVRPHDDTYPLLRLHVGLEDPRDLIDDLAQGLARVEVVGP